MNLYRQNQKLVYKQNKGFVAKQNIDLVLQNPLPVCKKHHCVPAHARLPYYESQQADLLVIDPNNQDSLYCEVVAMVDPKHQDSLYCETTK